MSPQCRVLVVDDDVPILHLMKTILREFHFEPLLASSAREALKVASETPPALILLDMNMPGISGDHAIQLFHNDPAVRHIPIVIVSGQPIGDEELARLGAAGAIQKPFDIPDLIGRIRSLCAEPATPKRGRQSQSSTS